MEFLMSSRATLHHFWYAHKAAMGKKSLLLLRLVVGSTIWGGAFLIPTRILAVCGFTLHLTLSKSEYC